MFVVTSFTCCFSDSMMISIIFVFIVLVYNSHADLQTIGSQIILSKVKVLTCNSDFRYPGRMVAYQEWNQVYVGAGGYESLITHLQPINALTSMFKFELEKFDNNTDIYSSYRVYNPSNGNKQIMNFTMHCSGLDRKLISLVDDGYYQYKIDSTLNYDESQIVKFNCHTSVNVQYLALVVAWINSAGDRIFPYSEPEITLNATEMHNASMLCCVYYTVTAEPDNTKVVHRHVKNKTLLIYRKKMTNNGVQPSHNNLGTTTSKTSIDICHSNITNQIGKDSSTTINETGKDPRTTLNEADKDPRTTLNETDKDLSTAINETDKDLSTTINEIGKDLSTTKNEIGKDLNTTINETVKNPNITSTPDKNNGSTTNTDHVSDTNGTNYVIIIISSVAVLVLVLLASIIAMKTLYRKKNIRTRAPCQLPPNEPASFMPFYVNLLFRRECDEEIRAREEPQYEEVMYQ